jgi:PAS domain S-box-containing protein
MRYFHNWNLLTITLDLETISNTFNFPFLQGGGEMWELTRNMDWSSTTLGPPDQWPQSLRITLSNVLNSGFPMFLFWGPELICFYNDAYRPSLGVNGKHPAVGKKGKEVWPEIWDLIGPLIDDVLTTGKPTWYENQLIPFYRNGGIENIYWTFSYSLIVSDDGQPGGVLVTCMETTAAIKSEIDLQQSETMFRNIIEQAPIALSLTRGEDFIFESINEPMLQMINKKDKQEVLGKRLEEVLPELVGQPLFNNLLHVLRTGESFQGTEIELELIHNGSMQRRYFNVSYSRIVDEKGIASILHMAADVTDQLVAKRKTEESEIKLRAILNSAPTAIGVFVGPELILENPNQLLIEVMGVGPDIEGQSFRKLLSGLVEEDQKFIGLIDRVRATGEPFEAQEVAVYFKASQKTRYFNISFIPLRDENGNVYAVLDVSVDISGQIAARQQLKESEERLRIMADMSPNLIWMLNANGSYQYVNQTTLDFLGITQELIAEVGWGPYQSPEELEEVTRAITVAVQNQKPLEMEHRLRHKDGKYRWMLSKALPAFDDKGNMYAFVGSSIDIHDAKQNQQALQRALEQARLSKEAAELGTFDLDLENGTMHWDDRCRTLFGISHNAPVSYENDFVKGLYPDDRERINSIINRAFIKSVSNGDYDVEYRTVGAEDGIVRWVRAKGKVYFDPADKPVRFIGSVLDITEQVTAIQKIELLVEERTKELAQANERLLAINQELQRSNSNLEEFAHAASHDMKEPIRKVLTFSDRLKRSLEDRLTETEKQLFSRVENATQRMGLLIDDLLEFSHVSERPIEKEEVNLDVKLERVLTDLEIQIEEKKAQITIDHLPTVIGYRRQLQQLFQNLVGNALKYSKPDVPPVIQISATVVTGRATADKVLPDQLDQSFHLIEVRDNGIGFEQQYEEQIFGMFQRLHGKAEYSGTGVGLSIVRKVVENHNGYIWAESQPGKGTSFKLLLPVS